MADDTSHRRLLGTRTRLADHVSKHDPAGDQEELRFVLVLRQGAPNLQHPAAAKQIRNAMSAPQFRQPFTRNEIAAMHAPAGRHVRMVKEFARDHGFRVEEVSVARHDVTLSGPVSAINKAFGIRIIHFSHESGHFHGHEEELQLPVEIADIVVGVLGLDGAPLRSLSKMAAPACQEAPVPVGWLTEHYRFPPPSGTDGRVAVIALDGGYHEADMHEFFSDAGVAKPKIRQLSVAGATNAPFEMARLSQVVEAFNDVETGLAELSKEFGADLAATRVTAETTMDIQIAGIASGGADIDVYFAPNSAYGLYQALYAIVGLGEALDHDGQPYDAQPPDAISLSWGWGEGEMSGRGAQMLEAALGKVQSMGVCICSASGDYGSLGAPQRDHRVAMVLYPASSHCVLACGGTEFTDPSHQREVAWNAANRGSPEASGGGVSGALAIPGWQSGRSIPAHGDLNGPAWINPGLPETDRADFIGRGVPDVSAYANQVPGYQIRLGGQNCGVGGTSAATPLWAGLIARLTGHIGRYG